MKISILSFDLSMNCLGRAYLLAKVLSRRYDVDIHGFTYPYSKRTIWKPCDTGEFRYHALKGRSIPLFFKNMVEMARSIDGDVIYASKPRLPSYGVALLKKKMSGTPVVLDIDDYEMGWFENLGRTQWWCSLFGPTGPVYTRWVEKHISEADDITTVSKQLQRMYGRGVIIPHGKDTDYFDPARYERNRIRDELSLGNSKIIMFLGTVRPHKGLDDIVQAVNRLGRDDIRFLVVGAGADPDYEKALKEIGGEKIILKGQIPFGDIPRFLHAADLVVLPQKKSLQSQGQIPAKIFDAMAMAKPIIATRVADLPLILGGCGIIVESGDIPSLAEKIEWVFSHPTEAEAMGIRARMRCIDRYSWDVMEEKLLTVFEKYR